MRERETHMHVHRLQRNTSVFMVARRLLEQQIPGLTCCLMMGFRPRHKCTREATVTVTAFMGIAGSIASGLN